MRPIAVFALAVALAGCYTEIGNPGKENKVTATFTIDYAPTLPKASAATPVVAIERFWFNVVEVNYRTVEDEEGRIWKVPDSLGRRVDFTGRDTQATLPPVDVPASEWTILKLESRIPEHEPLDADTLDFAAFAGAGYIKGTYSLVGRQVCFLARLPLVPKVNLVYNQEILGRWRHGDAYALEFVFYAHRWLQGADLLAADTVTDRTGIPVAILDPEHNAEMHELVSANFFKAFNSWKVWKE